MLYLWTYGSIGIFVTKDGLRGWAVDLVPSHVDPVGVSRLGSSRILTALAQPHPIGWPTCRGSISTSPDKFQTRNENN